MATFRFTAGPWNIHEGNETFGPGHRKTVALEEKIKHFAEIGMSGVQFHDDDAVPDMNNMSEQEIRRLVKYQLTKDPSWNCPLLPRLHTR